MAALPFTLPFKENIYFYKQKSILLKTLTTNYFLKKLFAILLLAVHLFNLVGYAVLFQSLINTSDSQLVKQLDHNNYNDKDLITVKVPLYMPYINDSRDFERVDGQVEMNGIHYNYVKRKVAGDTLYVLCLPNVSKTQLYAAKASFAKNSNDFPAGKKSTESVKKQGYANESSCPDHPPVISGLAAVSILHLPVNGAHLQRIFMSVPEQPPKASC